MAESDPKGLYGVHDVRFYNRSSGESIAHLRILGDVNPEFAAEVEKLMGGSALIPWDSEIKEFSNSLKITCREYGSATMEMLLGGDATDYAADAAGDVIDEANKTGTSALDGTTGVATVAIKAAQKANAKEGWYLFKATGATEGDVYAYSSADFSRGVNKSYEDDAGKITASPITIANGADTDIDDFGLTFTGGSAVAFVTGDTFLFYVQKPHGGAYEVKFGQSAFDFSDVGCVIGGQTNSGMVTYLHFYKCKCAGMSIPFTEKGYASFDITVEPSYDSAKDSIGVFRRSLSE